jgi:hypothetical protein
MGKPRPGGGECARGCGATVSSSWYGKKPNKFCRSCFGKETQRVKGSGHHLEPPTEVRQRGSPSSVASTEIASVGNALESWQDLQAQVKTVLRILGSRWSRAHSCSYLPALVCAPALSCLR